MERDAPAILIVDGTWLGKATTAVLVKNAGYTPLLANTAEEAINLLEVRTDIGLVITEIELPGRLDGTELLRLIRKRWPKLHLIVVSGARDPHKLGLPGRVRVFSKPYSYVNLATFVQKQLREPDDN